MSGVNTGILTNAYPLSAERIKELEKYVLESQEAFVYLNENYELCFMLPSEPEAIKDLAWNNAYLLNEEAGKLVKKVYNKNGLQSYFLKETLHKQSLDATWQSGSNTITDLTNTKWYLNDTLEPMGEYKESGWLGGAGYHTYYQINFTSNDIEFNQVGCVICEDSRWGVDEEKGELQYFYVAMPESDPYEYPYDYLNSEWNWWGEPYRTIIITGGDDATNSELIAWLEANATQQTNLQM